MNASKNMPVRSLASRKFKDSLFKYICIGAASISVIVLGILLLSVISKGYTYLITRAPQLDELKTLDWPALAEQYRAEQMEYLEFLPEDERADTLQQIENIAAGLALLTDMNWQPALGEAEAEDLGDIEDIDWERTQSEQNLPAAVIAVEDLDDDEWESLIQSQRIFALSAFTDFISNPPSRNAEKAGMGPAMWGSIWICVACATLALPIGIATAIFLEEYKPTNRTVRWMHGFLQLNITNLAGVPSIVYGIIGLTAFVQMFGVFGAFDDPAFTIGDSEDWYYFKFPLGRGVLAGGLTLMLVILPIVVVSAQESIRAVPDSLREGALASGATKWQMIWKMTLPAAVPGIMTGSILAMSRAIGEAAPILVIAGVVFIRFTPQNLLDDFTAMPLQIYNWAGRPQEEFWRVAASGIIVLLAVLLTFNATAVFIRQKFQRPLQ